MLAVTAVGSLAAVVGSEAVSPALPPPAASANPAPRPSDFVEFRDPPTGLTLSYPADWTRRDSGDPAVPLVAERGPHAFLVRVLDLPVPVGPGDLPAAKQVTDQIVLSNSSVKLLDQPKQISLGGLPGYFYFYTFTDPTSGVTGVHSHIFVFKGRTMIALIFQAVPADQFKLGAPVFDRITHTFRATG